MTWRCTHRASVEADERRSPPRSATAAAAAGDGDDDDRDRRAKLLLSPRLLPPLVVSDGSRHCRPPPRGAS